MQNLYVIVHELYHRELRIKVAVSVCEDLCSISLLLNVNSSLSSRIVLLSPYWAIQRHHFLTLDVLIYCVAELKEEDK